MLGVLTGLGFLMYKTPIWAWRELKPRMDPGMVAMIQRVKTMMDPGRLFNPGKMDL